MKLERKLQLRDKIMCKGECVSIKEILSQSCCSVGNGVDLDCIEFVDDWGNYRRWKPEVDGGDVTYLEVDDSLVSSIQNGVLGEFYFPSLNYFAVPFEKITLERTQAIVELLRNGYFLSIFDDGSGLLDYSVMGIDDQIKGFGDVLKCEKVLNKIYSEKGRKCRVKIPFENCDEAELLFLDKVLVEASYSHNIVDGYELALVCDDDGFKFVEVSILKEK